MHLPYAAPWTRQKEVGIEAWEDTSTVHFEVAVISFSIGFARVDMIVE